jgi:succinate dehydrogenase / fumarate reductase cytochrome b subunit
MSNNNRPLSPFIIGPHYKPQLTSMLSILHRITGAALAFGALLFAWWLFAALSGVGAFSVFQSFRESLIGQALLFGWLFAFVYHLLNGLRHLAWDAGLGFEIKAAYVTGYLVMIVSAALTAAIWMMAGGQ